MYNLSPDKESQAHESTKNLEVGKEKQVETLEDAAKEVSPNEAKAIEARVVATELSLPDLNRHLDQTLTESILASTIKAVRPLSNPSDPEGRDGKVN